MQGRPTSVRCSTRLAALLIAAAATFPAIAAPAADETERDDAQIAEAAAATAETAPATAEQADIEDLTRPQARTEAAEDTGDSATLPATLGTIASDLDLVEAQIDAREYELARTWLEAHVRELEGGAHRYDPALIRPLVLLGDANMGTSEYAEALRHYQRATHLARVSAGLKSLEQIEIVYREAAAYKAIGAYQEASDREEYAYQILATRTGPNDPALLPAVYRLADWYMVTGNPFAARELYQRAIRIHDATGELDTEAAIPALQGLATTFRLERFPPTYTSRETLPASMIATPELQQPVSLNNFPVGEEALQRVARIRQQSAAQAPMAHVEAVLDLADWYTLFDKPARANALYAHAFELLGQIPDTDRNGYFAAPRLLYFPEPGTPRSGRQGPETETVTGHIELGFDISETGYVRNLQTVESVPEGFMDLRARRSMRVARYRPALVDGVPVVSANQTYRHEFTYEAQPEDPPEAAGQDVSAQQPPETRDSAAAIRPEVVKQ